MKQSIILLSVTIFSLFIFSCSKQSDCEKNHTGSIMIHNDGNTMPIGTADFYRGSTKLASVAKGSSATVDNIPVGTFAMTVKIGADTIYDDSYQRDTINQCTTLHYYTSEHYTISDKRLKKNIIPIADALTSINKLNIYSYEYNKPKDYAGFLPTGLHYGFMAQELKEVYPTFVLNGNNGYYAVNYQEMIPLLAKGMQEQQGQIDELKKEVAELKSLVKSQQTTAMK